MKQLRRPKKFVFRKNMDAEKISAKLSKGEPFFIVMGLLLTAIVISGFGASALSLPEGPASLPLLYHIHGLIFLTWFVLFTLQASLIRNQRPVLHQALGRLSLILAVAMLLAGYLMMRSAYRIPSFSIGSNSHIASMMFPLTDLINFAIAFTLGLRHRTNSIAHKRLMLLAGILILDPAVARLVEAIGAQFFFIPIIELGLFVILISSDRIRLKRPHWTSLFGLALFFAAMAAKFTLAQRPAWADFAAQLFT